MNVHGSRTLESPRAEVFDAICDPETLLAVIPGCRSIERIGDTEFRGEISLRLPGIVGTYRTTVRLVETDRPDFGRMAGEVTGSLGAIAGQATFRLTDARGPTGAADTGTTVEYDGQATISGALARLDGRFVEGLAGSLIGQGLDNLDARLRHNRPAKESPG